MGAQRAESTERVSAEHGSTEFPSPEFAAPETAGDPTQGEDSSFEMGFVALDTHVDTPQRMLDQREDPIGPLDGGHLDVPRMREGGLSGAFFSVFVNPGRFQGEAAWERALALTERIRAFAEAHDEVVLCTSAEEVRAAYGHGKIAVLMGVEGAQALGTDDPALVLERLRRLYALGNRYMTITWSTDNALGHSSLGESPEEGLTPLGRRVVRAMNRLGMAVDVSHVSEATFWDIMAVTRRPVLASHSAARALADIPRNMSDAMIRRVAEGGGAVCLNFFSQFLDRDYRLQRRRVAWSHRRRFRALRARQQRDRMHWVDRGRETAALAREIDETLMPPTLKTLGAHVAHVVSLGGEGAACLGSDFDGVSELPLGMRDVRDLPRLAAELRRRGLAPAPIFGENVLRVLAAQGDTGADLEVRSR